VISNGVDTERFSAYAGGRARARAELGIPACDWVIGTAARLAPEKDQATLLRGAAAALRRGAHLLVAGEGPERPALEALAKKLGIGDRVRFLGAVADIPGLLRALDVFALSSLIEGLPGSMLEAMATELPVVATSVGGVVDAIRNGENGYRVPSCDPAALGAALDLVEADRQAAREMGRRAREWVLRRYAARRMHAEYASLYRRLRATARAEPRVASALGVFGRGGRGDAGGSRARGPQRGTAS
jgi:glycosyltransferase involved in cell wall biosynthesis